LGQIRGGPADGQTPDGEQAVVIWAVGFIYLFIYFGTWGTSEESCQRDWLLHQNFNFLLLADVLCDYWWA
jgi:hypothetical protein